MRGLNQVPLPGGVGFFGKLPGMGDFVQRRLPADFVAAWDGWLEAGVDAARAVAGTAWRAEWAETPTWRFALAPGVCGPTAWAGVMGPSVDRVGRTFPLVLASAVTDAADLADIVRAGNGWFVELERACCGACGSAPLSVDDFDAVVAGIADPHQWLTARRRAAADPGGWPARDADAVPWLGVDDDRALAALARQCFGEADGCLWWTLGSWRVAAGARLTHGLPRADAYPAFIGAAAATASVATSTAPRPAAVAAEPLDVLADLIPTDATATCVDNDDTIPFARRVATAPPSQAASAGPGGVAVKQVGSATLIAADNGAPDTRRRATADVVAALAGSQWWAAEPAAVRVRLLALHPALKERRDDLLDPVPEDGAVIAANVRGGKAEVWWIGSAAAWHWRSGDVQWVQPSATDSSGYDDVTQPATLMATPARPPRGVPGLGAAGEPRSEVAVCRLLPGERLLLLATDTLVALPEGVLAAALAGATGDAVCARLAAAAGLGEERARWPLAVIEVGT
ncbi:MAG TPA: type VI secretion system-associated protein TagF [Rhodanobacteraceae bacterium]